MEDKSIYSVVVSYTSGGSRGYVIKGEDQNDVMKQLIGIVDFNSITTIHIGEIFEVEDMMI